MESDISEPRWNYRKPQSKKAQVLHTPLYSCDFPEGLDEVGTLKRILFKGTEVVAAKAGSSSPALP